MTNGPRIRVLAIDDHVVVRAGLVALIDTEPDMQVVGQAATVQEALPLFVSLRPDVTLLDLRLPDGTGLDLLDRLRATAPDSRVIVYSNYAREHEILEAHKRGAWSYVRKGASETELLEAIRVVHSGRHYLSPDIAARLADHVAGNELSAREREVLQHVFEGRSNKEISAVLGISEFTVGNHVQNMMSKLGVASRTEAIAAALRKGILHAE